MKMKLMLLCICLVGCLYGCKQKDPKFVAALGELTKEEVPVLLIDDNRENISNIKYYEEYDNIDFIHNESADTNIVGYFMEFRYLEEDINYNCEISNRSIEIFDKISRDTYNEIEYNGYTIYFKNNQYKMDLKNTVYSNECMIVLDNRLFFVECKLYNENLINNDIPLNEIEEISLKFTYELIDQYNEYFNN